MTRPATGPMTDRAVSAAVHDLLLRLAGRLSDDTLSLARRWLAAGRLTVVADTVVSVLVAEGMAVATRDAELLAPLVTDATPAMPRSIVHRYAFVPVPAGNGEGAAEDGPDRAAVRAAAADAGTRGLWRALRYPTRRPRTEARRVYVVEMDPDADPIGITERVQDALERAGERPPLVEAYRFRSAVPGYQRLARAHGTLLYARRPATPVRIAPVFDHDDAARGPSFDLDHPLVVDRSERDNLVGYLWAGERLAPGSGWLDDIVDRVRVSAVPTTIRTDGVWVWSEASAYYLEHHFLAPAAALRAHLRSVGHRMPEVDGVAAHRAMAELARSTVY